MISRSLRPRLPISTAVCLLIVIATTQADERIPRDPPLQWFKGNIHTHSLWSDGNDFPEMISEWYRTHGYNFLAISDHNVLSEGQRWMKVSEILKRGGDDVIQKYYARFGNHWIEQRGASEEEEIRLKPLDDYRALLEERGKFILLVGEEISDQAEGKPVHMNATNLKELLQPLSGETVAAAMRANLRAAEDQARRNGREVVVHLNHPNFYYAITANDLAEVLEEQFYEVYNGHPGVNHLGDDTHPGAERIWDLANALRLSEWPEAQALFGVATDDSHNYHSREGSTPGRGWIMVQTRHLTPESLIRAMKAGDFYASSGVRLQNIAFDTERRELTVEVDAQQDVRYQIDFVGTKRNQDTPSAEQIGIVFSAQEGATATYQLKDDDLYVRAVITSTEKHPNPSYEGQFEKAWTQPVGWRTQ